MSNRLGHGGQAGMIFSSKVTKAPKVRNTRKVVPLLSCPETVSIESLLVRGEPGGILPTCGNSEPPPPWCSLSLSLSLSQA